MAVTVFTPTYNRAYILPNLYSSLLKQTNQNFIWLVVDDGSTDNTYELIRKWQVENKINIKYFRQENQGKSIAHNKGVEETTTELFCCVDSDDYLRSDAIELIIDTWNKSNSIEAIGILAFRVYSNGEKNTSIKNTNVKLSTLCNAYRKLGLKGDTMLIYKTEVIKKFRFPSFENEKFVPEAYLYDLLDQVGKLIILPKKIYIGEYLVDGYTRNMKKTLLNNPNGYLEFLNQRIEMETEYKYIILDTLKYISFCIASGRKRIIHSSQYTFLTTLLFPFGLGMYFIRYKDK